MEAAEKFIEEWQLVIPDEVVESRKRNPLDSRSDSSAGQALRGYDTTT